MGVENRFQYIKIIRKLHTYSHLKHIIYLCTRITFCGVLCWLGIGWFLHTSSVGLFRWTYESYDCPNTTDPRYHYDDVIMGAIASLIASLTIVYSSFFQTQIKENIKAPRHWPLCAEFTGDRFRVSIWWRHHVLWLNITRYWTQYERKHTLFRVWTHKRQSLPRPYGRTMGRLFWVLWRADTANSAWH